MLESLLRATTSLVRTLEPRQSLCILAARLMHDWLAQHGLQPAVLPSRVSVAECVRIGYGYPDDPHTAFGLHTARQSYNGHLVVRVGDIILDPTLGQASDPAQGIFTGPLLARVINPAFFAGVVDFADDFRWGNGPVHRVRYSAEPADLSYRRTYHWNDPQREDLLKALGQRLYDLIGRADDAHAREDARAGVFMLFDRHRRHRVFNKQQLVAPLESIARG